MGRKPEHSHLGCVASGHPACCADIDQARCPADTTGKMPVLQAALPLTQSADANDHGVSIRHAAMPEIPLMDYVGNPLLTCLFLALLWLQWRFPLRRQHFSVLHRLVRNFVLSIPGFAIVRLAMLPIPIAIAIWARSNTSDY